MEELENTSRNKLCRVTAFFFFFGRRSLFVACPVDGGYLWAMWPRAGFNVDLMKPSRQCDRNVSHTWEPQKYEPWWPSTGGLFTQAYLRFAAMHEWWEQRIQVNSNAAFHRWTIKTDDKSCALSCHVTSLCCMFNWSVLMWLIYSSHLHLSTFIQTMSKCFLMQIMTIQDIMAVWEMKMQKSLSDWLSSAVCNNSLFLM